MSTQRFEQPGSRPYSPSPSAPGPGPHGQGTAPGGGPAAQAGPAQAPQAQQGSSWPASGAAAPHTPQTSQAAPARAGGGAKGLAIAALAIVVLAVATFFVWQLYGRLAASPQQVRTLAPVFVVIRIVMGIIATVLAALAVIRSPHERRRLPGIALGASAALVIGSLVSTLSSFLIGALS